MTTPNTTPSAEEQFWRELEYRLDSINPSLDHEELEHEKEWLIDRLKSYKKEILEEVERKIESLSLDRNFNGHYHSGHSMAISQVSNLLNSLK